MAKGVGDFSGGTVLTHQILDNILDSEFNQIFVRNDNVRGIDVEAITEGSGVIESLEDRIVGRVLAEDIFDNDGARVASVNTEIDKNLAKKIASVRTGLVKVKDDSVDTLISVDIFNADGLKIASVGDKLDFSLIKKLTSGTAVLSFDIFDSKGVKLASSNSKFDSDLISKISKVSFPDDDYTVVNSSDFAAVPVADSLNKVLAEDIYVNHKLIFSAGTRITADILSKLSVIRSKKVKIRSVLTCKSQFGVCIKCYGADLANQSPVEVGEAVGIIAAQSIGEPGTQLTMRTFHTGGVAGGDDITQGLPRVEELFEARKPKHNAIISEVEGAVTFGRNEKNNLIQITVTPSIGSPRDYTIPYGSRISVNPGDWIDAGTKLTEGSVNPHDILRVNGLKATQQYLVYEVQKVYKSQGVEINDKHIEVMVRQMLHKVKIEDSGNTEFLPGEFVDINVFEAANTKVIEVGGEPAVAKPILLGITKASLATDSFLSAASFQETTKVLTDAAIKGKIDPLIGLKENVIIGKLIPAGTGMPRYRNLQVVDNTIEPQEEDDAPTDDIIATV